MNTQKLDALDKFAFKRPGFEWANYAGYPECYRADYRTALTHLHDYREMSRACRVWGIEPKAVNRVEFVERKDGAVEVDYCVGQYWPTEYRAGACRALASALWAYVRASHPELDGNGLRAHLRKWFGVGIQRRWFN